MGETSRKVETSDRKTQNCTFNSEAEFKNPGIDLYTSIYTDMHANAKMHAHLPTCIAAGTLRPVYGGSPSLPHHKCVFAIRGNTGRKEEFMWLFI